MNIAIASGKGGTGKTTLATNLVSFISSNYNKQIYNEVVLVDLDVEEPNSGLFIKGDLVAQEDKFKAIPQWDSEKCILCGECKSHCNFNAIAHLPEQIMIFPELCHSCYACSELCPEQALPMINKKMGVLTHYKHKNNNLSFVEGKMDIGEPSAVQLINQTKSYIDSNFPKDALRIYDSPPGTSCPVIESVKDMDLVILVTEPTPFGLHDLKLAVETMLKLELKFVVVINRDGIGNNDVEKYCDENKISIIGKIPNMKKAAELCSQGKLLYAEIPEIKKELEYIFNGIKHFI